LFLVYQILFICLYVAEQVGQVAGGAAEDVRVRVHLPPPQDGHH
jgi:hypothetical protein